MTRKMAGVILTNIYTQYYKTKVKYNCGGTHIAFKNKALMQIAKQKFIISQCLNRVKDTKLNNSVVHTNANLQTKYINGYYYCRYQRPGSSTLKLAKYYQKSIGR